MKLLVVLGSDKTYDDVSLFLKPQGFELIRYRNVQKAMDNIDEVDPVGIIISAKDFPRHWKTMTRFVRFFRQKNECPIVLLRGEAFPKDESNKAKILEINGIMPESLNNPEDAKKIQTLFAGHGKRTASVSKQEVRKKAGFVFSHPVNEKLVTGTVKTVTADGISFELDQQGMAEGLKLNTKINACSLRTGKDILSPICAVRRTGKILALDFLSFPGAEKETLEIYLG